MKTLNAEWIEYMHAWRLYDVARPESTAAYYEDLNIAVHAMAESGYERLEVVIDRVQSAD